LSETFKAFLERCDFLGLKNMKKIGLVGILLLIIMLAIAIFSAGQMGETSHAFAQGRVVLDRSLMDQGKTIDTLFIVMSGSDRPMPLGALRKSVRVGDDGEVYRFILTKDNMQMMMGDQSIPDSFKLKARLDRDGQGGADQPGDLVGEVMDVKKGQRDVEIQISRAIP
jgi:hypothetical protein